MKDTYKANLIKHIMEMTKADEYYFGRLYGDDTKRINLDYGALQLLYDYYNYYTSDTKNKVLKAIDLVCINCVEDTLEDNSCCETCPVRKLADSYQ